MSDSDGDEPIFFHFGIGLRIFGDIDDFDAISAQLGLTPTRTHRRGDRRSEYTEPYPDDMWWYEPPVPRELPLDDHIQALWQRLKPHRAYLFELKQRLTVDVFCRYTTNALCAGFMVSYRSLEMFIELETPFGVSIIA